MYAWYFKNIIYASVIVKIYYLYICLFIHASLSAFGWFHKFYFKNGHYWHQNFCWGQNIVVNSFFLSEKFIVYLIYFYLLFNFVTFYKYMSLCLVLINPLFPFLFPYPHLIYSMLLRKQLHHLFFYYMYSSTFSFILPCISLQVLSYLLFLPVTLSL